MEQKGKLPAKLITIEIGGNNYEVKFPSNGQLIDIEALKIRLSGDTQRQMLFGVTTQTDRAYMLIEAISVFSILIPKLKEDLRVKNLTDLNPYESKVIVTAYVKQFQPWYNEWFEWINKDEEQDSALIEAEKAMAEDLKNKEDDDGVKI